MVAANQSASVYAFDDSKITWHPFAGIDNLEFSLYDLDVERQVIDLIVKFEPNKIVALHNHLAQTNMMVIQGELRMYETDGALKEVRPAGSYTRGKRDDVHSEGGGADGAIVFYSVRGHGDENMFEIMDGDAQVLATLTMADLRGAWEQQRGA
ncbi:MAG: 2,4'-dihydroxyacetophenone dioxygenase [Gammaproteobacteria bacterium]|jgi:quercetin dioxygenase-like cupin family protein